MFFRWSPGSVARVAPARAVPGHDASLLRTLFRGVQFPDTEWWWNAVHVKVQGRAGEHRELSIITNVQLMGQPLRGELRPAAVVAVRDVHSGERWISLTRGTLSSGENCCFHTRGWSLSRVDPAAPTFNQDALAVGFDPLAFRLDHPSGAYVIRVKTEAMRIHLVLSCEGMARFGEDGWLDYDPSAALPLWASNKVRLLKPSGRVSLRDGGSDLDVVAGDAHFEQQAILVSAMLPHLAGSTLDPLRFMPALAALAELSPKWHWYRVLLPDAHLCVFVMWSTRSHRVMHEFGVLLDRAGQVATVSDLDVRAADYYPSGPTRVPGATSISLKTPGTQRAAGGRYQIHVSHDRHIDWLVPYACPFGMTCLAHEAFARAQVTLDGVRQPDTPAIQETIDLPGSMSLGTSHPTRG